MKHLFITVSIILLTGQVYAANQIYDLIPECKVYKEPDCTKKFEYVGERMQCYRRFIEQSTICKRKANGYFKSQERELIEYEKKKLTKIRDESSAHIEKNYEQRSGQKIDEFYSRAIEKAEGSQKLRGLLSYINRVTRPAAQRLSEKIVPLIERAREAQKSESKAPIDLIIRDIESVLAEINIQAENYETYKIDFEKQIAGFRSPEIRSSILSNIDATRNLIIDLYTMRDSLSELTDQLRESRRKIEVSSSMLGTVTKGEVILRKLRQLRDSVPNEKDEILFYERLCMKEFEEKASLCESHLETKR